MAFDDGGFLWISGVISGTRSLTGVSLPSFRFLCTLGVALPDFGVAVGGGAGAGVAGAVSLTSMSTTGAEGFLDTKSGSTMLGVSVNFLLCFMSDFLVAASEGSSTVSTGSLDGSSTMDMASS